MNNKIAGFKKNLVWIFLLLKSTSILQLLKFAKFAKPIITLGSMGISVFMYSLYLSPWFAVGFVLMTFIHEMGHVLAMKVRGYSVHAPIFIPFFGAAIFAPEMNKRSDEAYFGYGGPLLGTIGTVFLFLLYLVINPTTKFAEIVILVAFFSGYINLFNLLPIKPFDGGRITQIIGDWFFFLGLVLLIMFTFSLKDPSLLIIWILVMDDFQLLSPPIRFGTVALLWLIMSILLVVGYSEQVWIASLVYILLGAAISFLEFIALKEYCIVNKRRKVIAKVNEVLQNVTSLNEEDLIKLRGIKEINTTYIENYEKEHTVTDMREYPQTLTRVYWFSLYVSLSLFLIFLIVTMAAFLPPNVKQILSGAS